MTGEEFYILINFIGIWLFIVYIAVNTYKKTKSEHELITAFTQLINSQFKRIEDLEIKVMKLERLKKITPQ